MTTPQILGILNITDDSFSDGGRYIDPAAAIAHARQLTADGADLIDIGAESTGPDSRRVTPETEIARLTPVVQQLKSDGLAVSIDTYKPAVIRAMLARGVDMINDVTAARDPETVAALADSPARLILMHSVWPTPQAQRGHVDPAGLVDRIIAFFEERIATLTAAGIDRERLILDPGMGLFIGSNVSASIAVLRGLPRLAELGLPLLISAARKSFVGTLLESDDHPRPLRERETGTLAVELYAVQHGATCIRTHAPRPLHDMLRVFEVLNTGDESA